MKASDSSCIDSPLSSRRPSRLLLAWFVAIIGLLTLNWVAAIARFQVNGLYWDQWEICRPLFEGSGLLSVFTHQHGPHRQGLAFIFTSWVMDWSDWDSRVESLWIVSQLVGAAVLALRLKLKLTGRLGWEDSWIPIAVLGLLQYEHVILIGESSHSVFPLLLLLMVANLRLLPRMVWLYPLLGLLALAVTFTGNGLFGGGMLTALLALDTLKNVLRRHWAEAIGPGLATLIAAGGCLWFVQGFAVEAGSAGYHFPHEPMSDYGRFVLMMLAGRMGWTEVSAVAYGSGALVALVATVALSAAGWRVCYKAPSPGWWLACLFLGTSLSFAVLTSVGRVHLGAGAGIASRYTPLLVLCWLGIQCAGWATGRKAGLVVALLLGWMMAIGPWFHLHHRPMRDWVGTVGLTDGDLINLRSFLPKKMAWLEVFESSGDWREAERRVPNGMHPLPEESGFEWKINWLREHGRSFFRGGSQTLDWLPWVGDSAITWLRPWGGGKLRPIGDEAAVLLRPSDSGFLNLKCAKPKGSSEPAARVVVTLGKRSGEVSLDDLAVGLSLPVEAGAQVLKLSGIRENGTTEASVLEVSSPNVRLQTPSLTTTPEYSNWSWSTRSPGLVVTRELQISTGFHGWEASGKFGWSDARLEVICRAQVETYLNVSIESRYDAVDSGPVVVRFDERTWSFDLGANHGTFSLLVPADGEVHHMVLENPAGARRPVDVGESGDVRPLALKINRLAVDDTPDYPLLP